jgi:hypothetical protein
MSDLISYLMQLKRRWSLTAMVESRESKACTNCAKARRKCGKQRPHCLRCQARGRTCHYPSLKPSCFVPLHSDTSSIEVVPTVPSPLSLHFSLADESTASWWFASPETWTIDAPLPQLISQQRFISSDFDRILQKVMDWLAEWIETGSNPFIHQHLYQTCFPTAIQDAYIALSSYLHKNPTNTHTIHRIIADRVTSLVASGLPDSLTSAPLDTLAHVQALVIYQVIGFSSPDIRLRALASKHVIVLETWMSTLMQNTRLALLSLSSSMPLWHTWILAESVRRIWLITAGLQGLYKLFTCPDLTRPCMGGTMFTSRRGFWEAGSARAWEKECSERYAGLVRLTETEKLFEMVPRGEISEFTKVVLGCTFGVGWCEERGVAE